MHRSNDKRVIQTKAKLTNALLVQLKEHPLYSIKISDLCDTAGISRATFYNNFDSMDEIVFNLLVAFEEPIRKKVKEIRARKDLSFAEVCKLFVYTSVEQFSKHYDVFGQILQSNTGIAVFDRRSAFYYRDRQKLLLNYHDHIKGIPFDLFCCHISSALTGRISFFCLHQDSYTLQQQQEYIYRMTYERYESYFHKLSSEETHVG